MHYAHVVTIHGTVPESEVQNALDAAMMRHYYENEEGNEGQWDWFVVGGRWGGYWTLKEDGVDGPLTTDPSTFGLRTCEREDCNRIHTDCARLLWLEPESMHSPYGWIDLVGDWHTKWLGPEKAGTQEVSKWEIADEEWNEKWLAFVQSLDPATWMILVDYHD